MNLTCTILLAAPLATRAVISRAAGLRCYISEVEYDGSKFNLLPSEDQNCPDASTACITRSYLEGFVAHQCSKGFENCTVLGVEKASEDDIGKHTFSCCRNNLCNVKQLRLPETADTVNSFLARPECSEWMPKDYDANDAGYVTKAEDLEQGFTLENLDQRTQWTVDVQPPTAKTWLYTRDTSSPSCFSVAGFIKTGFCGVRYNVKQVVQLNLQFIPY